jgi:hypothetical protein
MYMRGFFIPGAFRGLPGYSGGSSLQTQFPAIHVYFFHLTLPSMNSSLPP